MPVTAAVVQQYQEKTLRFHKSKAEIPAQEGDVPSEVGTETATDFILGGRFSRV